MGYRSTHRSIGRNIYIVNTITLTNKINNKKMTNLKNKVALITGASRGIGKAIALRFASLGANIVVNYTDNKKSADDVLAQIKQMGVKGIAVQADVSKTEEVSQLFDTALKTFGKLDIVVVNAGLELLDVPVVEFTEEQFDKLFSVNTKGAFFTMQAAAKNVTDGGRIIYTGSSTMVYPTPGFAIHGGSKVAPGYLVQVLSKEVAKRHITVNAILPTATEGAGVHTNVRPDVKQMVEGFNPMGRMGTPEDAADIAEFFAGELSNFVSGQMLMVAGGGIA
jgi:3-oxoacyl-[acyl-carrier protein] reductase